MVHPVPAHKDYEFGDPKPNAVGRNALVSHSHCVAYLEADSKPRLIWSGEDLLRVKLPAGTRVVYPKPAIPGLKNREAAIRYALEHPEEAEPLVDQLRPGMKVTIAIDDISLPLPKMNRPDIRQSVLEVVLEMLAANGVTDVDIIIATSFHRRMEPFELKCKLAPRFSTRIIPINLLPRRRRSGWDDGPGRDGARRKGSHEPPRGRSPIC
ncbi:MAG: lactate racemase domain-containing protein [Bryobacterales bacterium]